MRGEILFSIPVFRTQRLILRGIMLSDAPSYQHHFNDYEIIRYLSAIVPWPYPPNGVAEYIKMEILPKQGNNHWFWGIFLQETPQEMIGGINLWRAPTPENRGFWLGRSHWGKGIMTEALIPIMDCAFGALGFTELILGNAKGNIPSRRLKEKVGAQFLREIEAKFVDLQFDKQELWRLDKQTWENYKALLS
jgi:[ribosomal protein S5]-alanine N-acetyltransferase